MLKGDTVIVEAKVKTGKDAHENPVYETVETTVGGVLIAPGPTTDLPDSNRPEGVTVAYSIYWPKTFNESLRGKRVKINGGWYDVIGDPKPWEYPPPPTGWHMVSEVTATHG